MAFRVEPVPAPQKTFINMTEADMDDRLVIQIGAGYKVVFQIIQQYPRLVACDLERTSPKLISEICQSLIFTRGLLGRKGFTAESIRPNLYIFLSTEEKVSIGSDSFPVITIGDSLYIDAYSEHFSLRGRAVGGAVQSIDSAKSESVPILA